MKPVPVANPNYLTDLLFGLAPVGVGRRSPHIGIEGSINRALRARSDHFGDSITADVQLGDE